MNFLQESVLRRYFAFLLLFLALLTGFGILYGTNCIQAEKNLLLAHDRAFVSSLLEEDIPPETILRALKQAKETERGAALLRQSGWTERTSALFLPQVRQAAAVSMGTAVGGVLLLALFLMGGSLFFLTRLDRLYRAGGRGRGTILRRRFHSPPAARPNRIVLPSARRSGRTGRGTAIQKRGRAQGQGISQGRALGHLPPT